MPQNNPLVVVIATAGNAQDCGREIENSHEKIITREWAHALKNILELRVPHCAIIISDAQQQPNDLLHHASFCNQLHADLFITLHAYHHTKTVPALHVFYTCYDDASDSLFQYQQPFCFIPATKAYTAHYALSKTCATLFSNTFTSANNTPCVLQQPLGLPLQLHASVLAPSCALEIGIKKKNEWTLCVETIATALQAVLTHFTKIKTTP